MRRKPVFGRHLKEVHKDNHDQLPEVFTESIDILRQRGMELQGLFSGRCEGRKAKLLEKAWDMGRNPLKAASFTDCYAVADSLLLWLKALPAPVIPCRLFPSFLGTQTTSCHAESLAELHLLFSQLEECELQTLEFLLGFLHDYQQTQQRHRWPLNPSLGQIFAPSLLRGIEGPLPLPFPEDVKAAASLVDGMIKDYAAVFNLPAQCDTPCHKPPSGAKRRKWSREQAGRTSRGGLARDLNCPGVLGLGIQQRFAASAPVGLPAPMCSRDLPMKHLRVNVVPPLLDTEEPIGSDDFSEVGTLQPPLPGHFLATLHASFGDQPSRMATLPECSSLTSSQMHAEPELEVVFDQLLCGSMENLFADDKSYFASLQPSGSSRGGTRSSSSSGGSDRDATEMSTDEDMVAGEVSPPNTPGRTAQHPSFQPHVVAL